MTNFEPEIESIISRQFDGELSSEEHQRLQEWINAEPANAQAFVEYSLLHDRLRVEVTRSEKIASEEDVEVSRKPRVARGNSKSIRWALGALASIAALLLVSLFVFEVLKGTPSLAAETQLERLIEATQNSSDRTYLITAVDIRNQKKRRRKTREGFQGKHKRPGRKQAPVDGAILHLRGQDCYVLIRRFKNGEEFITGSDGKTSWSIPRRGPIRVSNDLKRFRSGLPGNQHAIPFINMHEDLEQIRDAYRIRWLDSNTETAVTYPGLGCLIAEKKSAEHRGPKYVEIWFNSKSGTINEMLMDKLPQAGGLPKTVLLELIDQSALAEDYFQHSSYHDSEREVIYDRG